ncbi:MAG: biopolymer transporter ExbD [Rikenellaceae bacterium]|jgi:biopolymer transport protein ExbD|nr:biopolymer transporter ExbD [Rikenellaceae bacterium]MDR0955381.1 biopolymer transporter ExbD [Rikenellaceae bacterium]
MAIKRHSRVDASFSPSSMTDLIFLLLVFFIVLTTMISPNAIKVLLPQSNSQTREKAVTSVVIDKNLNYYIETTPVPFNQLESRLQERMAGEEEPMIALRVEESVPVGEMIKVRNIFARNNYEFILVTRPEE